MAIFKTGAFIILGQVYFKTLCFFLLKPFLYFSNLRWYWERQLCLSAQSVPDVRYATSPRVFSPTSMSHDFWEARRSGEIQKRAWLCDLLWYSFLPRQSLPRSKDSLKSYLVVRSKNAEFINELQCHHRSSHKWLNRMQFVAAELVGGIRVTGNEWSTEEAAAALPTPLLRGFWCWKWSKHCTAATTAVCCWQVG